jgi:hypothetical protein
MGPVDDFRAWLLERAQVPGPSGMVPPVPTPAQDMLTRELGGFFRGEPGYYAAVKSRQIGWTTWLLLWSLWRASHDAAYVCIWVAPHDKIAGEVLAKARAIAAASGLRLSRDNAEMCEVEGRGRIVWATIGGSVAVADVVGRAGTFSEAILTETAYPYEPDLVWVALDALRPALRRWRAPVMLDSTPNGTTGRGAPYYRLVSEIRAGELAGAAALAPWWLEPSYVDAPAPGLAQDLTVEEVEGRRRHGWTLAQIQWRRNERRDARARAKFAENYPEDWESCWLDRDAGAVLTPQTRALYERKVWPKPILSPVPALSPQDPIGAGDGRSGTRWYAPAVDGLRYYAGLDSASGRAKDAQALVVLDGAGHVVCAGRYWLDGPRLASVVARACAYYGADLTVEAQWSDHVAPYLRGRVSISDSRTPQAELDVLAGRWRWRMSVESTTAQSRGPIIAAALDIADAGGLSDEGLWAEVRGLRRGQGGRVEAGGGGFDDLVMALGLAAAARARGLSDGARRGRNTEHSRKRLQNGERGARVGQSMASYLGTHRRAR